MRIFSKLLIFILSILLCFFVCFYFSRYFIKLKKNYSFFDIKGDNIISGNYLDNDENTSTNLNEINNNETFKFFEDEDKLDTNNLYFKFNNLDVIGALEIEKINYKGVIFEGTSEKSLKTGIGHFECSPILQGNVCLAGHNYKGIWANLYKLENGNRIKYSSKLGSKNYEVYSNKQVNYDDVSVLNNTSENILTLITCVKNKPSKRICVQAKEIL